MKGRNNSILLLGILFAAITLAAQSTPDLNFGGHTIGEPAEVFFATARTMVSKELSKDYCKSLLDDPNVKAKVQESEDDANAGRSFELKKKDFAVLDVSGCKQIGAALKGDQAKVGARLASEIGKGSALFAYGRLNALSLAVDSSTDSPCDGVIADMQRRFGFAGKKSVISRPGSELQETRWQKDKIVAVVRQAKYSNWCDSVVGILEPPYDTFLRDTPAVPAEKDAAGGQASLLGPTSVRVQVSAGVMQGLLFHRVQPVYPESAKQIRIQGTVVIKIVIGADGHIVNMNALSGPAELIPAAMDGVRQWQYRPYLQAGQAVEVQTQVQCNFVLAH